MSEQEQQPSALSKAIQQDSVVTPPEIKLLVDEISGLRKKLEKEQSRNEILKEVVEDTLMALPPLEPFPRVESPKSEQPHAAMLDISDVHIGGKVEAAVTGGMNEYNYSIFLKRGAELHRGLVRLVDMQRRVYPVDELYINCFGDFVEGVDIYQGQAFQIDRGLVQQIFLGADWFSNFIVDMAARFDKVNVRCVPGNHGRGYRKGQGHPLDNFDTVVYWGVAQRLSGHANVNFEISESSWLLYHIPGHEKYRHVIIHGDEARSWMTIPWYGFERVGQRLESMLGIVLDYVHAGHHHNEARWANNRMEFLVNGSWVGGSELSVRRMLRTSRPVQNLFFCHPRRGVVSHYPIQLDTLPELSSDERGIWTYPGEKK